MEPEMLEGFLSKSNPPYFRDCVRRNWMHRVFHVATNFVTFPLLRNQHWSMFVVVSPRDWLAGGEVVVVCADSSARGGRDAFEKVNAAMKELAVTFCDDKKEEWKETNCSAARLPVPRQNDVVSCGPRSALVVAALCQHGPVFASEKELLKNAGAGSLSSAMATVITADNLMSLNDDLRSMFQGRPFSYVFQGGGGNLQLGPWERGTAWTKFEDGLSMPARKFDEPRWTLATVYGRIPSRVM